jgi:hypothetical protein
VRGLRTIERSVILSDASLILAPQLRVNGARAIPAPRGHHLHEPVERRVSCSRESVKMSERLRGNAPDCILSVQLDGCGRRRRAAPYEVLVLTPRTLLPSPTGAFPWGSGGFGSGLSTKVHLVRPTAYDQKKE